MGFFSNAWSGFTKTVKNGFDSVNDAVFKPVFGLANNIVNQTGKVVGGATDNLTKGVSNLYSGVGNGLAGVGAGLGKGVGALGEGVGSGIGSLGSGLGMTLPILIGGAAVIAIMIIVMQSKSGQAPNLIGGLGINPAQLAALRGLG
jgi:phage-related protein